MPRKLTCSPSAPSDIKSSTMATNWWIAVGVAKPPDSTVRCSPTSPAGLRVGALDAPDCRTTRSLLPEAILDQPYESNHGMLSSLKRLNRGHLHQRATCYQAQKKQKESSVLTLLIDLGLPEHSPRNQSRYKRYKPGTSKPKLSRRSNHCFSCSCYPLATS